jgi:apolipoprotein N-acyltransferase
MQKSMSPFLPEGKAGHAIAFLAGMLITLSLAPYKLWPAAIAAIVLYTLSLFQLSPRQAFIRGWWFGFGVFSTGVSWVYVSIHTHGHTSPPLATLFTGLFCAGLALLYALPSYLYVRFFRDKPLAFISFAAIYVLNEWTRTWLLTGFPWMFLGYSQVDGPLAGWAPIAGTLGLSFLIALTGSTLTFYLLQAKRLQLGLLFVLLACWLAGPVLNEVKWVNEKPETTLSVSTVQANIPQEEKWLPGQLKPTLHLYRQMTQPLLGSDIIVWPETAIPRLYHKAQFYLRQMGRLAKEHNSTLITGLPYMHKDAESGDISIYNSVVGLGDGSGIYHKRRLVPFGEYLPLDSLLRGVINFFNLPMSDFSPGPDKAAMIRAGEYTLAPFLCYEIVYPNLVRSSAAEADILLTISNDTWFGDSNGPLQHMEMARMRAQENGRYLIRSTNNGVTALVDHKGKVTHRLPQFTQDVLRGEVKIMQGTTPFTRLGHWPTLLIAFLLLAAVTLHARFIKRSEG